MVDSRMPFVAVIGGFWKIDPKVSDEAKKAAGLIGESLAKAGCGLVVYFSNNESLEPYVVSGYMRGLAAGAGVGAIRVRYADSQRGAVSFAEEASRKEVFDHKTFPGSDWEAPFYRSLAEEDGVDAVLLMAGAASTLIAGQIAVARKLPILAVNAYGGSAETIWRQLAYASTDLPSWDAQKIDQFVKKMTDDCAATFRRKAENRRRDEVVAMVNSQNRKALYATSAFILLLVSLILGMVYPPVIAFYTITMLVGLVASGATGALMRSILWPTADTDAKISALLGAVAGFVVGLAYLIPQWVGAPGVLDAKASVITSTDKIQFISAVLVAISAGIGFDTVFTRLQKQAQDVAVGPGRL